jgi:NAD(P)-dependent dehydrogenase (short-subunit alcohol dehydrogenase family)
MIDLTNKTFFITGASSGLGKAISNLANQLGAFVILVGRNKSKLTEVKNRLKNPDKSEIIVFDLEKDSFTKELLSSCLEQVGKIDGLVHCAGIDITKPYKLLKTEDFEQLYKLNVTAPFKLTQALLHKSIFNKEGGSIIFMSSVMGALGQKGKIAYTTNKAAIYGLVNSLALELATKKIRVNAISPGIVETPLTNIKKMHPLGFGTPEDVAQLCAFLLSDSARWITGTNHFIDGGYHIH